MISSLTLRPVAIHGVVVEHHGLPQHILGVVDSEPGVVMGSSPQLVDAKA